MARPSSIRPGVRPAASYLTRLEFYGATPLPIESVRLLSVSANAELALIQSPPALSTAEPGVLALAPMIGGAPRALMPNVTFADWSPRGDAMAIVRAAGSRQQLEFPIGTVLYQSDGEIGFPRIAPSGDRVAFLDWPVKDDDRGTVAVVDVHRDKRTLSRTWEAISGLAWDPDGLHVWYSAAQTGNRYSIWTTAPDRPETRVFSGSAGTLLHDISRDGRALVAEVGRWAEVDSWRAGDAAERPISQIDYSYARDISADGTRVLVTAAGEGTSSNYDVYVMGIDGAAATRIGEGQAQQFSPDERFALSIVHGPPVRLMILPLGAGEPRVVATGDVTPSGARWLPNGRQLLIVGAQPGKRARAFVVGLDGSPLRPVSPEGVTYTIDRLALSPNGSRVALRSPEGAVLLYRLDGGAPSAVEGLAPGEMPAGWTADGRSVIVHERFPPMRVFKVDPATGARSAYLELKRSDPNMDVVTSVVFSADGRAYAANYQRRQSTLFVVDGLIPKE